jgi:predicted permease
MTTLLLRSVARPNAEAILGTLLTSLLAAVAMGVVVWLLARGLAPYLPQEKAGWAALLAMAGFGGAGVYLLLLALLGVREVRQPVVRLWRSVRAR